MLFQHIKPDEAEQLNFNIRFLIAFLVWKWGEHVIAYTVGIIAMVSVIGGGYLMIYSPSLSWQAFAGGIAVAVGFTILYVGQE